MIKLIYGSDTGNTEHVIDNILLTELENKGFEINVTCVNEVTEEDWNHNKFILGIPTWYDGELQSDWEDYFDTFKEIDFTDKTVAIFGLGDQIGYEEWFCDGIGILAEVVLKNGGEIFGYWNNEGYDFNLSKGLAPNNMFYGLVIDEDNQYEQTDIRIEKWVEQIKKELKI